MNPRILTTYSTVTPESAEHGDVADSGWIDEDGVPMGDDDESAVDDAVKFLKDKGVEPSSSAYTIKVFGTPMSTATRTIERAKLSTARTTSSISLLRKRRKSTKA